MTAASPLLQARDVSVRFGGITAVDGVSLEVRPGQIVGLIGPNGAGKTTFVDALTGFVPAEGTFVLGDTDISRAAAHVRARHGLTRTWQSTELFEDLTIRENLGVVAQRASWRAGLRQSLSRTADRSPAVERALEAMELEGIADRLPSSLSHGRRKLVGVARALVAEPRLLVLDEPAAGLDTQESEDFGRRLRAIADAGLAMLLIDHDMGLVLGSCDHVYVLEFGKLIASGPPAAIRNDEHVARAYLGSGAAALAGATS